MTESAFSPRPEANYPVQLDVEPAITGRDRLTTAFRLILAIPHLILVGGPVAGAFTWSSRPHHEHDSTSGAGGAGGGVIGVVAVVSAIIAWFAILFTGKYPDGLWKLVAFYLRWRARAAAYTALLRDEYPPFGEGSYPASLELTPPTTPRDRLSVAFRILLAIPQLVVLWLLGIAWACTSIIAWFAILLTGKYPAGLYRFGVGALRWNLRVESYLLLLHDAYPPFSLD
jgi:hypothetical protein